MLKRQALGHAAALGSLYDARTDSFVSLSILKKQPPPEAITKTEIPSSYIKYTKINTYKEKFQDLDISPDLGASYLAGFFSVDGSGRYLDAKQDTNLSVQASLILNIMTVNETISFQAEGVEGYISTEAFSANMATHVVAGIDWGSRNVVTVKHTVSQQENTRQVALRLEAQLNLLGAKLSASGVADKSNESTDFDSSFEVTIFGDVNASDGLLPSDLASAAQFLSNVPKYVASVNYGKGKPLTYTLLPISSLSTLLKLPISRELAIKQPSFECSEKFVQLFDDISSARRALNDYRSLLQDHREYIPQAQIRAVGNRILEARTAETRLQSQYASSLRDVREGTAEETSLWAVLESFEKGETAIHRLASVDSRAHTEKTQLIQALIAKGAKYVGFNGESLDLQLGCARNVDVYVFYFSENARRSTELWKQNVSLIYQLLDSNRQARIILSDCDAFGEHLPQPRIALFHNSEEIIEDVLEDRKISASRSTTRYVRAHLDRSGAPKPPSRILVKMPCPGPNCSLTATHDWICATCNCQIEYGHTDQYIYCDCGRCDYRHWSFKCSGRRHGMDYGKFDDSRLVSILTALEPFEELNILILGRTGVGKSTWINAFANYLMFPTLDDALSEGQLCWHIPFAFQTYNVNAAGEFEDVKVKVGFEEMAGQLTRPTAVGPDEHDGTSGASATQRTAVHRIQIGNCLLRLIDTPGVGDTRGASQDKENMADILSVLRSYNKLHGILILLKPNDQKLDFMFKFCVQELLTHLHRDAAKNLAFGFTNTRGTNYMPGDTFDPLRKLLQRFKDVEITLRKHNVYCFDSESFRYLAAQKQHNKSLGHLDENRASWNYSVQESKRLIDYFRSLPPHRVTSTVNLYETRHRIVGMTEPMAAIAETIRSTISVNEDEIQDLLLNENKKKDLEKLLRIEVKTLKAVKVDSPRTACAHESCVEHSSTGIDGLDGKEILKTVYKTLCHNPCYLTGIKLDDVGNSGLRGCSAMEGSDNCRICGHLWMTHLHINYIVQQGTKEINDPEIEEALQRNASFRTKKELAISAKRRLIEELNFELSRISDAAAQFSIFLKRNAIMPYNDATLEYLDRHMQDERNKVQAGGSRDKLDSLTQYRKQYEQQVKILDKYMQKGEDHMLLDQDGVKMLVKELYKLKHYGKILRDMRKFIRSTQTVVYRERPYVMRARSHWTGEEENLGYPTTASNMGDVSLTERPKMDDEGRDDMDGHNGRIGRLMSGFRRYWLG
jgi:GTPase SAR1 family protein